MNCKKLIACLLVTLIMCAALFVGCRKEDGEIPQENGNTNTPVESVESMIPDSAEKILP